MSIFYIVSLKHTERRHKLVTFWRPNDAGYCWALSWAGGYTERRVLADPGYYNSGCSNIAVLADAVDALAVPNNYPGLIDGDAGPVVLNTAANWRKLLAAIIQPPAHAPHPQYPGAPKQKEVASC